MKIKPMTSFLKIITGGNIAGITLCPFGIYVKEKYVNDKFVINHESIHWKQQLETLVIFFYLLYLLEYIIKLFVYGGNSYRNLSFEREAYNHEKNLNYLSERKHFSWLKYIFHN